MSERLAYTNPVRVALNVLGLSAVRSISTCLVGRLCVSTHFLQCCFHHCVYALEAWLALHLHLLVVRVTAKYLRGYAYAFTLYLELCFQVVERTSPVYQTQLPLACLRTHLPLSCFLVLEGTEPVRRVQLVLSCSWTHTGCCCALGVSVQRRFAKHTSTAPDLSNRLVKSFLKSVVRKCRLRTTKCSLICGAEKGAS